MSEEEEDRGALPCKVVLIGESGVGKTSIITRYMTNTFSSIIASTPGANFTTKTVFVEEHNQSIKFEIWDTAGQEKYRSLAKVFYKNAAVCILVYEITRKTSFEELKKYWIGEIKANSSKNLILALAGNKSDMYEYEEVSDEEGMNLAKEIGAIYQRTSAKENNGGVDVLFKTIGKKFLSPDSEITSNLSKEELKKKGQELKKERIKNENQQKGCCK